MEPLILLGLLGVGGYFLFSSTAPAAASPAAPPTPQAPVAQQPPQAPYVLPGSPGYTPPDMTGASDQEPGGWSGNLPVNLPPTVSGQVGWNPFTKRWY